MSGQGDERLESEIFRWRDALAGAAGTAERAVNLVPSENRLSPLARSALTTDFYNRYFFNEGLSPDFWEFRGGEDIGGFEADFLIPALRELGRPEDGDVFVNARPISGLSAMVMVMSALGGDTSTPIGYVARSDGGHFATRSLIARMGYEPRAVRFSGGAVVPESLREVLADGRVRLLYLDLQNFVGTVSLAETVALAKEISPRVRVHADVSHTMGLVLGGVLPNPLAAGADSFGGSTHKSFPGPQKGVLFTGSPQLRQAFLQAQFDLVSSHHFAETLALGFAAAEFRVFGAEYARQVVSNARFLAAELRRHGFLVSDPESVATHQVWLQLEDDASVWKFTQNVKDSGIRLNVQKDLPGIPGLCVRLGTNEVTFLGARNASMTVLADALAEIRDGGVIGRDIQQDVWRSFGAPYFFPASD